MSDKPQVKVDNDGGIWIAVALLIIVFHGEPDIHCALMEWLTK